MPALKVLQAGTWVTVPTVGPPGPTGPSGVTGPVGPATVIIGNFGAVATPADLPVDGLLPVDWDGPGNPAVAQQVVIGESLYYDAATGSADPQDGHLYQYVSTTMDPTGWIDIGLIQGPPGPTGLDGATGPTGPTGPPTDEVLVGPDTPTLAVTELWYDTDDDRLIGPYDLPVGGATYDALSKTTDLDGDIGWRNVYSVPSGKVIQFPNTADVAKIQLYSTTFGLGITGSTLNLFSSSNIKFNQNSITGTELANIHLNGMTLNSGHLYFPTDGDGVRFNGDGYVYKKVGSGMKLRKSSGNPQWQIENNDGGGGRDIATTPDSEATVAHNATNFDGVRAGQNYILYNDSIVCWYVTLTPKVLWENSWQEVIPPNGFPDFLRPARTIERWKAAPDSTGNATCVGIGLEITAAGKVSCWKPGDGPDIKGETIINVDFVYPRNY